jgi:hypothetical protein
LEEIKYLVIGMMIGGGYVLACFLIFMWAAGLFDD